MRKPFQPIRTLNQSLNGRVALLCGLMVAGMVGMSYAAVPLYDLFCRVTGYGGTTQVADAPTGTILDRKVIVRFDSNVNGLPWEFQSEVPQVEVKLGESAVISYRATNASAGTTYGTATFNVTPPSAGIYFNKLECFCFTEQELAAGESMQMPVQFFVDPDLDEDSDLDSVKTITLSYTFFPQDAPQSPVAALDERDKQEAEKL